MGSGREVDRRELNWTEKCKCGQGKISQYTVYLSSTKSLNTYEETEIEVDCNNPECPSNVKK